MYKILIFFLLLGKMMYSQNFKDSSVYVIIDKVKNKDILFLEKGKNDEFVKIKILFHDKKDEGFLKIQEKKKDDIINIYSEPNINYFEFLSYHSPKKVESINDIDLYSIEDISKNIISVRNKKRYIFIEKLKYNNYHFWHTHLVKHE